MLPAPKQSDQASIFSLFLDNDSTKNYTTYDTWTSRATKPALPEQAYEDHPRHPTSVSGR